MSKNNKLKDLIKELSIDEKFTKPVRKPKVFTKVKDMVPPHEDYNFMADLLMLKPAQGYKYLLVIVDLWTDEFDMEPLKNKDAKTVLAAMKTIFERPYLNKPYATLQTDNGSEFKGVFNKWLRDNDILHKQALPDRHTQMANVERLNRSLGRIINGWLNNGNTNWIEILPTIRSFLNQYRKKDPNRKPPDLVFKDELPKFIDGDIVYRQYDSPHDYQTGERLGHAFRMGDLRFERIPRKIVKTLYYPGKVPYRYVLTGIPNASFTEHQLMKADELEEKYIIDSIKDKKKINGRVHYLVKWKGYDDMTFEPRSVLIEDVPGLVEQFEEKLKKKAEMLD